VQKYARPGKVKEPTPYNYYFHGGSVNFELNQIAIRKLLQYKPPMPKKHALEGRKKEVLSNTIQSTKKRGPEQQS